MKKIGLCAGRHEMPVDEYIFGGEIDPTDITLLASAAGERLNALKASHLELYVTGLTPALVAVLNAAVERDIEITLMHFDRKTGEYYAQPVLQSMFRCPYSTRDGFNYGC